MSRNRDWDQLRAPDEAYLQVAMTHLLPRYYAIPTDEEAGAILRRLAAMLSARHHDAWLSDAMHTRHTIQAREAFLALGRTAVAIEAWEYKKAGLEGRVAAPLFASAGSDAGLLYSQFGYVYSLARGPDCAQRAAHLGPRVFARHYQWVGIQLLLEEGTCAAWSGDLNRFDTTAREALHRASQVDGYPGLVMRNLGLSASWHAQIGDTAEAWTENFRGLKEYWEGRFSRLRAYQFYSALALLGGKKQFKYSTAAWAKEVAAIASAPGHRVLYPRALWQLGLAELGAGEQQSAYDNFKLSVDIDPDVSEQPEPAIDVAALETGRGATQDAYSRLREIQPIVRKSSDLLRLRYEAEMGRVRLRQGDLAGADRALSEALKIGESSWARAAQADRLPWARTMEDIYRGLLECRIRTGQTGRGVRDLWAQYRARLFEQGRGTAGAEGPVTPGEARLSFVELSSSIAAWLETAHGFSFREIRAPEDVRQAAERLSRGCASEPSPESVLRADARELSRVLLDAWDARLDGVRTVVVETDAAVAPVPWTALVRSNGHYWSQDFAVRIRQVAGGAAASRAPLAAVKVALAVGAPAVSSDFGLAALPHAREEALKVSRRFSRSYYLTGQTATRSEVMRRLGEVELFHFAGHGFAGEGGGLLLRGQEGGPALLRAADIRNLNMSRCRLVVLGGGSTAAGERKGPGDPQSLVRAFLRSGARDVVAGLWNLDSDGTEVLIRNFYEAVLSGEPVAESLRLAARSVRADERFSHPYYWAGLQDFSAY